MASADAGSDPLDATLAVFDRSDAPTAPYTASEVADELDCTRRTAYNRLERLAERGDVETKKVGARGRVWWRPLDAVADSIDAIATNGSGGVETVDSAGEKIGPDRQPADSDLDETERALRQSEHDFRTLVKAVEEYAIFRLDPDGRVVSWNEGAERIKGYDREEILGEHVSTFYTDDDVAEGVPERNLAEAASDGVAEDEGWRVRVDGTRFWATVTITAIRDDDGDLRGYAKVTRDMTDDKYAEAERTLLHSTTRSIAAAGTFEDGLRATLREVCEATDWEFGEAWVPTDGVLERADADYAGREELETFAAVSEAFTFERGEGLPGRVWASGDPEWIADVSDDSTSAFLRVRQAERVGIESALGVPITTDDEVVAVLVLVTGESQSPDERAVELVSSVAAELGEPFERQRAETELAREKELTDRILDVSQTGIAVFAGDGEVVRANEYAADLMGIPSGDVGGYTAGDLPLRDDDGEVIPFEEWPVGRVFETGEPVTGREVALTSSSGDVQWVSVNATPLEGDDGELERVVATIDDVTRLKEQARRLERQRDDLRSELDDVFERIDDGFFALDGDLRFTYVNERAESLLDAEAVDLLGRRIWDEFEPGERAPGAFEEAMETQESTTFEEYYEPLDTWFETHVYPSETGVSVYFRDVTGRKERERELERYRRIVETVEDGVYVVNDDGEFVLVNDAYADTLGYDPEELLGSHVSLVADESVVEEARELERDLRSDDADRATAEAELRTADGETVPTEATFSLLPTDDGVYRVGVTRDVTERKRFEETLRALYDSTRDLLAAETGAEVSEVVTEAVTDVLDLPGVVVYRYDADQDCLVPESESVEGNFMRREFPELATDERSITGLVFADGDPRHYDDVLEDPHLQVDPGDTDMRAGSFVPMDDHGILVVGSRSVGAFDHRTRQLVELLAANAEAAYDRVERERELEESEERYRTLVDNFSNGAVVLFDEDLQYLAVGGEIFDGLEFSAADLEGDTLPERLPEELLDAVGPKYRAVFDGTASEFQVEFDGQIRQFQVFPVTDESGRVFAGMAMSQDVTERVERERKLERQRERLTALNNLNAVVRDINEALVQQSTREEVAEVVCERLADSDSYMFAWFGEVDSKSQTLRNVAEAGVDGYFDQISLSVDPDEPEAQGPTGRAVQTRSVQVTKDALSDPDFGPWREEAAEFGFRSSAAIPVVHEDTLYGVLGVYTGRSRAFEGEERRVVRQLGEVVGHAIASIERKQALMSDEVVELEFRIRNVFATIDVPGTEGTVSFDRAVPVGDGEFIQYGTATENAVETLEAAVEALPYWEELTTISDEFGTVTFELRLSEPPVLSAVASNGGYVETATIEDGDYHMTLHFPPTIEVRNVVERVRDVYPSVEVVSRRQVSWPGESLQRLDEVLAEEMTDRQRTALESAYFAGFFEWPRDRSAQEVADSLGVSDATFHQHVRLAEQKLLSALFDGPTTSIN